MRLGINIDHVATLRNARGGVHPDPLRAAQCVQEAGADSITIHLREDRRHIRDDDVRRLCAWGGLPINLEMASTQEMCDIALQLRPQAVCLVPEKRQELTTEGGLDVRAQAQALEACITPLKAAGIAVALFVDPVDVQIDAAVQVGAAAVELHTGTYCELKSAARARALQQLQRAAQYTHKSGLACHAGHGLCYETVGPVAAIPEIEELNIGHFLVGESVFVGLKDAILRMRTSIMQARGGV